MRFPIFVAGVLSEGMGFLSRIFGGDNEVGTPPAVPEFDYELICVRGKDAVRKAVELRSKWSGSFCPVIIGTEKDFQHLTDVWDEDDFPSAREYLESAVKVDLEKWFELRKMEDEQDPKFEGSIRDSSQWNTQSGAPSDFSVVREVLSRKFHPWVLIAKIPTPHPWEIPAYLKFGSWNEVPEAPVHVALWRKWQEKYGAEILCVSGDVIEATVSKPPVEKAECYQLANEQFIYCSDIVTQGVGTIDALAATLRRGESWYFWWD